MRPVDLNNLIPKTQQISKMQQVANDRNKNFMHNQITNQNRKFENELKKVNTTDKAFETKIKKDDNKNNKNMKENSKQDKKDNNKLEERDEKNKMKVKSDEYVGSRIDIKI